MLKLMNLKKYEDAMITHLILFSWSKSWDIGIVDTVKAFVVTPQKWQKIP